MNGFQIVDSVATGVLLNEEGVLVNGNRFGNILGRESFGKMSGFFHPDEIMEMAGKAVAETLFSLDAIHMGSGCFLPEDPCEVHDAWFGGRERDPRDQSFHIAENWDDGTGLTTGSRTKLKFHARQCVA